MKGTNRWGGREMVEGAPAALGMRHPLGPTNRRRGQYEPKTPEYWAKRDAMQAGAPPMSADRREANYRRQTGRVRVPVARGFLSEAAFRPQAYAEVMGLTPRQRRRSWKKADVALKRGPLSQADIELGSKGAPVQRESVEVAA